jgi:hypothetical protein
LYKGFIQGQALFHDGNQQINGYSDPDLGFYGGFRNTKKAYLSIGAT